MTSQLEKRPRSPCVPFIGLLATTARARQLYDRAKQDSLGVTDLAGIWGLAPKSSALLQTIAALLAYGLAQTGKNGGTREIRTSDPATHLFAEPAPGPQAQQRILNEAALKPKLIAQYAAKWRGGRPGDDSCIGEFTSRHRFTKAGAARFLKVFDQAMWFVGGGLTGIRTDQGPRDAADLSGNIPPLESGVRIGDYVRCTGQVAPRRKVVWLLDGGRYLSVQGDLTPLPSAEVTIVDPPPPPFPGDLAEDTAIAQPAFPVLGFGAAIQCARDLLECAGREWVSLGQAASAWFEKPERGIVWRNLAGLLAFGLAEQSGSGNGHRVRVSELGRRAVEGSCIDIQGRVLAEAASKPPLIADYAARWRDRRPEDDVCVAQLISEHGFTEQMAARFLRVFEEANFFISRYMPELTSDSRPETSSVVVHNPQPASVNGASPPNRDQFNIVQRGKRLEITGNVDLAGLHALREILANYEKSLSAPEMEVGAANR
jgi:hypothetical protein